MVVNRWKSTPKSWTFLCEGHVHAEIAAKFQHYSLFFFKFTCPYLYLFLGPYAPPSKKKQKNIKGFILVSTSIKRFGVSSIRDFLK